MIILISGGCKNGKTSLSEKIINKMSAGKNMYYVATMVAYDTEDLNRINNHINERKKYNFNTIEIVDDIKRIIDIDGYILFDSLTAYLLNHIIDKKNVIDDKNLAKNSIPNFDVSSDKILKKIINDIDELSDKNIVFISDYLYSDAIEYNSFTNYYIKTLASIEKYIAKIADSVLEISAGNIIYYKGKEKVERYIYNN